MSNCNSCPSKGNCNTNVNSCGVINHPYNNIKNVIGIMSGKGGVGKSTVTTLLAKQLTKMGYKVGILDSDITGPSIPRLMGLQQERAMSNGNDIYPIANKDNIKTMSINYMVDTEDQPVIWKGPMITNAVKQFYSNVLWGEIDYLLIDMPPGTGDVAMTVMQSLPINGVIMVSVPQDMISIIVSKAINMAKMLNVKVLGVIENMSYIQCPDCNKKIKLFDSKESCNFFKDNNINILGELPMTKEIINITHNGVNDISVELETILKSIVSNLQSNI